MGGSDLALVLEAISQLDDDLARLRAHADDLGAVEALRSGLSSLASLRAVLGRAVVTMRDLRTQVLETAIATRSIEQRESALHARSVVIVLQLAALREAERELLPGFWEASRTFSSIADVTRYLCGEVGRVNSAYLAERRRVHEENRESREMVTAAIMTAETSLDAIGLDPGFACFIAAGASVRNERFRTACRMIATLLGVSLAPEVNHWRRSSVGSS